MGDKTGIQWTDATWNCVVGCTHVSDGCDHCYAASLASGRLAHTPTYQGLAEGGRFNGTVRLLPERLDQPLRWKRPRMIFVNSMSDLFHKDIPDGYIAAVFAVMAAAPQHTFQVLTKRHGRMRSLLSDRARFTDLMMGATRLLYHEHQLPIPPDVSWRYPLPNVWLGVSVENQHWADSRIPALLETPAAVRFLSCEPLLGPVNLTGSGTDLTYWLTGKPEWAPAEVTRSGLLMEDIEVGPQIDWVIVGGESGHNARPMHPAWARTLRDQCRAAGVAFFLKQWGEWGPLAPLRGDGTVNFDQGHTLADDGTLYAPNDLAYPDGPRRVEAIQKHHDRAQLTCMYRVGKHAAGRELDGREWDEYPQAVTP